MWALKRLSLLTAAAFLSLMTIASVQSSRPPALLTFATGGRLSGLCLARADGSHAVQLTSRRRPDGSPSWSPDGKYVAFSRTLGKNDGPDVLIADARGRVIRNISRGYSAINTDPSWSPDGRQIAFVSGWHGSGVVVIGRRGENRRVVANSGAFGAFFGSPTWSPDGTHLAYDDGLNVYTIRVDGTDQRLVASYARDPAWSPEGGHIAFTRISVGPTLSDIVVANADGTEPRSITSSPDQDRDPAWSPAGNLIAFVRITDHRSWIVVVRSDTAQEVVVVQPRTWVGAPTWRPPTILPRAKRRPCR